MHAAILFFLTIRKEQPDTKVNEIGHPGRISCQQLLQLPTPQKAGWASVNCQAKFREYSEFSWDKLKQIEVFQKGSFSRVAKSSPWLVLKISLLTFANLPLVFKALCFSHCEAVSAKPNGAQRKPSGCACAHCHLCRAFPVLPGSTYTDRHLIFFYLNFTEAQMLFSWQDRCRWPWPFLVWWYPKLLWSQLEKDGRRCNKILLL